jgi:hypothetical protein
MADDLLNPSLSPVSWTTGTASQENRPGSVDQKNRSAGKGEKRKKNLPVPGEATEEIEADEHEIDSFA